LNNAASLESHRPVLHSSLSAAQLFSRYEPKRAEIRSRSRASTLSNEVLSPKETTLLASEKEQANISDVFDRRGSEGDARVLASGVLAPSSSDAMPADFDELPIELASLADR
jgi:hypothetical protein